MPNRYTYTDQQKQKILERLIVNDGDVIRTSAETGISENTLRRWRRQHNIPAPPPPLLPPPQDFASPPPLYTGEGRGGGSAPVGEVATSLRDLQTQMLMDAHVLAQSIQSAIADAPLGQRVAALAQLIDRIIKLAAQLPTDPSGKPFEIDNDDEDDDDEEEQPDVQRTPPDCSQESETYSGE